MGYATERASALQDIANAGSAVTFTMPGGTSDFATGVITSSAASTVAGYAIQVRGSPIKYQTLSLVQSECPTLLFAPTTSGQDPLLESSVVWGGIPYIVKDVDPLDPDGLGPILYRVIVGR